MLSLLSFLVYALSAEDVFPWPQDGATMLSLTFSADEGLRSTTVGVGYTRLISTVSAEEILRSVQRGGETMLSLTRLALLCWQYSMSLSFGLSIGNSRLLVSVEETSSGRRIRSLSESLAKGLRGGRVLLQKGSEDCDGYKCLQIMRSWRRAGMEATAMPMFCSRAAQMATGTRSQVGFLLAKLERTVLAMAAAAVKIPSPMTKKIVNLSRRLICRLRKITMGSSTQRRSVKTAKPTHV